MDIYAQALKILSYVKAEDNDEKTKAIEELKGADDLKYVFFKSLSAMEGTMSSYVIPSKAKMRAFIRANKGNLKELEKQSDSGDCLASYMLGKFYLVCSSEAQEELTGKNKFLFAARSYLQIAADKGLKEAADELLVSKPMELSYFGGPLLSQGFMLKNKALVSEGERALAEIKETVSSDDKDSLIAGIRKLSKVREKITDLSKINDTQSTYMHLKMTPDLDSLMRMGNRIDDEINALQKGKDDLSSRHDASSTKQKLNFDCQAIVCEQASTAAGDLLYRYNFESANTAALAYLKPALSYCIHTDKGYWGKRERYFDTDYFLSKVSEEGLREKAIERICYQIDFLSEKFSGFMREQQVYSSLVNKYPSVVTTCLMSNKKINISDSVRLVGDIMAGFNPEYARLFGESIEKGYLVFTKDQSFTSLVYPVAERYRSVISCAGTCADVTTICHEFGHICHLMSWSKETQKKIDSVSLAYFLENTEIFSQLFELIALDYLLGHYEEMGLTKGAVLGEICTSMGFNLIKESLDFMVEADILDLYKNEVGYVITPEKITEILSDYLNIDNVYEYEGRDTDYIYSGDFYIRRFHSFKYSIGMVASLCLFQAYRENKARFFRILNKAMANCFKEEMIPALKHAGLDLEDEKTLKGGFSFLLEAIEQFNGQEEELFGSFYLPKMKRQEG